MTRTVAAVLSLAVLALSGCGAYPNTSFSALGLRGEGAGKGETKGFKGGHGFGHGAKGGPGAKAFGLPGLPLLGVELTAEQKTALKAIAEKYMPADAAKPDRAAMEAKRAEAEAKHAALKAALTAETFDAAALTAALTPAAADAPAKPAIDPAMLGEVRALLTEEQRATAIAKLKEAVASPAREKSADAKKADFGAKLAEKLALTDDQKAKLAAVDAARAAAKPDHDPAQRHAAMITFLETGDAAGLTAEHARPQPPVDAIVDFVGSLDATQRAKLGDLGMLLGHGGPALGKGGHGFGGPKGGHGGGHGKRFGFRR